MVRLIAFLFMALLALPVAALADHRYEVPDDPMEIHPLMIGNAVPAVVLEDDSGKKVRLDHLVRGKPTVLIFYRGGWCPYCNMQLGDLARIESRLLALGYQIIAISMDAPQFLRESRARHHIDYTLLSDRDAHAAKAFGLAYRLKKPVYDQYRSQGVDIELASGRTHHILPVPAAFVVRPDGIISFSYVHPDYRIRVDGDVLLAAARAALKD